MKVSLVATVRDAAPDVGEFLESVRAQTLLPDEIVIVDGGSTDGTVEILRQAGDVALLEAPGSNIARGRNLGIEAATHDVIAVSDADCVLTPDWLEHLARAIDAGADVAMGITRPIATSFFQTVAAAVAIPEPEELDEATFMPSSRSIAFRRDAFERAGGYPERLDVGEDMYLNHRLRELYAAMVLVPGAVAYWRMRPTLVETVRQYFRYAEGDGIAGMYPERHALRFAVYGALAFGAARRNRVVLGAAGVAAAAWASRRIRRAFRLLPGRPLERAASVAAVPALMALTDVAKMAGYAAGLVRRGRR
jgi:glycosyltransferase involved in cell wall biosynthesis